MYIGRLNSVTGSWVGLVGMVQRLTAIGVAMPLMLAANWSPPLRTFPFQIRSHAQSFTRRVVITLTARRRMVAVRRPLRTDETAVGSILAPPSSSQVQLGIASLAINEFSSFSRTLSAE